MRSFLLSLGLMFGASGIAMAQEDPLAKLVEESLTRRGVPFEHREDGRYEIQLRSGNVLVSLDNLARQYSRDKDPSAIDRFLDSIVASSEALPSWSEAKGRVFPMLESAQLETGPETLTRSISDKTILVLAFFSEQSGALRFLRSDDLEAWGVSQRDAWSAGDASLEDIARRTNVTFLDANNLWLGVIEAQEPHKASLIRTKSIKVKVEEKLGWPVLAVAPSRGFVYLMSKSDAHQLGRVGAVVQQEYRSAEYPISTEVWELSDAGIRAIGEFPEE